MRYVVWTEADIEGLLDMGIVTLYTEVDDEGIVCREVGVGADGRVRHRTPVPENAYGLFDNVTVQGGEGRTISAQAFEDLWRFEPD